MTQSKAQRGHEAQAAAQPATPPAASLEGPEHQAMAAIAAEADADLARLRAQAPPQADTPPAIDGPRELASLRSSAGVPGSSLPWVLATDRIETAWTKPDMENGEQLNSGLFMKLNRGIRGTIVVAIGGVASNDEYNELCELEEELQEHVRGRIAAWAGGLIARRGVVR